MKPNRHYWVITIAGFILTLVGVLGFLDPELLGLEALLDGVPVVSRFSMAQIVWLLLGFSAGRLLTWFMPARCPDCRVWRSYMFREGVSGDRKAVKYRCTACGHVHDIGMVETPSQE